MKQYYIYKTINLINNKMYIGQHYGEIDDNYFGSGSLIKAAINKYGRKNFKKEILEICTDYDTLNEAEKKWINFYNAVQDDNFYNIASGGFNSNPCLGMSEEADLARRQKLSEAAKGERNHFYGQHFVGEKHPRYGKTHSEESKQKMREHNHLSKRVAVYSLQGEFIQECISLTDLKRFLGMSPSSNTQGIHNHIKSGEPYHGYIIKFVN